MEVVFTTKSVEQDDEKRLALYVVLVPEETDAHGDIYSAEVVEKACHNFNLNCGRANFLHEVNTNAVNIVESYVAPSDFTTDSGVFVKKGTWLQSWHFPADSLEAELAWRAVKSGELNGLSIGAKALVTQETP
jgi:hypothetical protein